MGKKRNERRLAAKIGAGRRVKLDLFADPPSGELGCSSPKDELENDVDAKLELDLPHSPSSGQLPENPLSLLGQYSDDELGDVSNKAVGELQDNKQAVESISEQLEDGEIGENEDQSCQKAGDDDECRQNDSAIASASQVVNADDLMNKMVTLAEKSLKVDGEKQDSSLLPLDVQTSGDVNCSWKMVLHEESNRYYYWNTVSGETSWEIPEGMVQDTTAVGVSEEEYSAGHGVDYTNGFSQLKMVYEQVAPENQSVEQTTDGSIQLLDRSEVLNVMPCETSTLPNYILPEQYNGPLGNSTLGNYAVHDHSVVSTEQSTHFPSQLVNQSESLLENLKLLQGSGSDAGRHALLSRYTSEINLRLSDIRALLPYGSSLLPFWVHTERQLNQLENSINSEIVKQDSKISGTYINSPEENYAQLKGACEDTNAHTTLKMSPENCPATANDNESNGGTLIVAKMPVSGPITHSPSDIEGDMGVSETALPGKASSKPESQAGEDVEMDMDMDIDMEVEALDTGGQLNVPLIVQPNASMLGESLVPESELFIPPPPEEEWIPPPPPDDEGIPPPPPDEPPESLCTPPTQAVYGQQYNMNYAVSNLNNYDNTSTASLGGSLYERASNNQVATTDLPVYFSTTQPPIVVQNPIDPVVYHDVQSGSLAVSYLGSDSPSLEKTFGNASVGVTGTFLSQPSSVSAVSAPETVSGKHHALASAFSAASTAATASDTVAAVSDASASVLKTQSKVSRMKKPKVSVGSSLRSNKKVSSLVDKWKAAKEELKEEEERYETPLEILERKRQREIEDWRAQQIASGEAKENANFQPLGGNWRERVKRRKAQKEAAIETPSEPIYEGGIKQPDLKALSKDLPQGWQVYWDDSSRQIYYSNSITSETTWTRPT